MQREKTFSENKVLIFIACTVVVIMLVKGGAIELLVRASEGQLVLSAFVAGTLFTSLFTTPLSFVLIGQLAALMNPWTLGLISAAGALVGDLFLLVLIEDHAVEDIEHALSKRFIHKLKLLFRHPLLHWLMPALGAVIIASPLPDELGLTLMGLSRVRPLVVAPISYVMNFLGIMGIVLVSQNFLR